MLGDLKKRIPREKRFKREEVRRRLNKPFINLENGKTGGALGVHGGTCQKRETQGVW